SYDEAGHLNGVYDSTGHLLREFAYDENHCLTRPRQPGGEGSYYHGGWYEVPDDAAVRATGDAAAGGEHIDRGLGVRTERRRRRRCSAGAQRPGGGGGGGG
ncbi:hypothetical protein, partial [Escherichia coli]|uniref:hypothetical protein n=1 Tax=Escherichia coli TaxID=562 RepID=UPI0010CB2FC3